MTANLLMHLDFTFFRHSIRFDWSKQVDMQMAAYITAVPADVD